MREGTTTQSVETLSQDPSPTERDESGIEKLEREKAELVAGIGVHSQILTGLLHDLRTPIVAIRGYARMLLEERAGPLNQKQRSYLSTVAENAGKLIGLANDLDLLRTASPVPFSIVRLDGVVRECLERLLRSSPSIKITDNIPDMRICIVGDAGRIGDAIFSLLCHAVRLSRVGDELKIEIGCHRGEQLIVRISNQGTAISPDVLEDLFSPKGNPLRDDGGPELELWQVRRILWLNGCRIDAKSCDNSFVFTLEFASSGNDVPF
jgi:signal transduction histidine kinase